MKIKVEILKKLKFEIDTNYQVFHYKITRSIHHPKREICINVIQRT